MKQAACWHQCCIRGFYYVCVTHFLLHQALQTVGKSGTFRDSLDENGVVAGVQGLQERVEQGKQQHATVDLLDHDLKLKEKKAKNM